MKLSIQLDSDTEISRYFIDDILMPLPFTRLSYRILIVLVFLYHDTIINRACTSEAVLHFATLYNNDVAIRFLIERGLSPNSINSYVHRLTRHMRALIETEPFVNDCLVQSQRDGLVQCCEARSSGYRAVVTLVECRSILHCQLERDSIRTRYATKTSRNGRIHEWYIVSHTHSLPHSLGYR